MFKRIVASAAAAAVMAGSAVALAQGAPGRTSEEQLQARQRVATMEAILATAVSNGADSVIFKVRNIMGGDQPILLGAPRVRGFRLEGYGVFFDVEVPDLRVPILWPVRHLIEDARGTNAVLAEFRILAAQLEDPASRARVQALITKLQAETPPDQSPDRLRTTVAAASLAPEPARVAAPAPVAIDDPVEEYRKQVKAALVNAMLENSGSLSIGPDERLTVAARRNVTRDPIFPGDTVDTTTWIASIKGSDLAALGARRITVAEARRLVEEREQ